MGRGSGGTRSSSVSGRNSLSTVTREYEQKIANLREDYADQIKSLERRIDSSKELEKGFLSEAQRAKALGNNEFYDANNQNVKNEKTRQAELKARKNEAQKKLQQKIQDEVVSKARETLRSKEDYLKGQKELLSSYQKDLKRAQDSNFSDYANAYSKNIKQTNKTISQTAREIKALEKLIKKYK